MLGPRDVVSLRDVYELSEKIDSKLDKIHDRCTVLEGRVGRLEDEVDEREETKRSWRDYIMNGIIAASSALVGVLVGRGG